MVYRQCVAVLFVSLLGGLMVSGAEKDNAISIPDWLSSDKPVDINQVSEEDHPYLARWLGRHAKPAQEYMVQLFDTYQIVILAEEHNVKEHKDFVINLIPKLYHEAGVRCIGWEFSPSTRNKRLEELINAPSYDKEAVLQFARDCSAEWNSKEHWQIIEAIWKLNEDLKPGSEKMRLIGLPDEIDIRKMYILTKTKPMDSPEVQEMLSEVASKYDPHMAQQVEKEILQRGRKGLLFVGLGHDWTHYQYPPEANSGFSYKPMGSLLKEKHGDKVFQVRPLSSADPSFIDEVMKRRNHEWIGFSMGASPFANILVPVYNRAPDVPWSRLASGYIYIGPRTSFHRNTAIKGFVNEEMFTKYKHYYEIDFGRSFNSAEEVDEYSFCPWVFSR